MNDDVLARLDAIEERNRRVELDKMWEVSLTRRALIAVITYFAAGFYMVITDGQRPWVAALVPTLGFSISTMGISIARNKWQKNHGY